MTRRIPGRLLLMMLVVALATALPLAYQLREIVRRTIVIPVMYLLWQASLLVQSVDSLIWWAAFLTLALALFWKSLKRQRRQAPPRHAELSEAAAGRVGFWVEQLTKAETSRYALWQTQRDLAQIAADIQAHGQQTPTGQAAQMQAIGSMGAPTGVAAFLNAGLDRPTAGVGRRTLFGRDSWLRQQNHTIEHLQATIAFLEDKVEAGHGTGHHADGE